MKSFRHIFLTGMFTCLLAACGSRQNSAGTSDSILSEFDEPAETGIPLQTTDNMNEISVHENYIRTDDDTTANIMNIVNLYQFTELICCQEVMNDLAVDNYALLPDSLPQLFQVYQRNNSLQIPNFVTVDLMAQLTHVYESYVVQKVEMNHFSPILADLCLTVYRASIDQFNKTERADVKNMAAWNAAFFAIAYTQLTNVSLKMPLGDYQALVDQELAYIAQQERRRPALLEIKTEFDYSIFKPYGHYTRTAEMRRYFRAWKWLQLTPYCCDNRTQKQRAALIALALQTAKTPSGAPAMDVYSRLTGAMQWFVGTPAHSSLYDMALSLKKERITTVAAALDARFLAKVNDAAICLLPPPAHRNEKYVHQSDDWDVSSYNKRLESLIVLQETQRNSPVFAKKQAWIRKNAETSSAMRLKMKHNVLLYGVIPDHPEPKTIHFPSDSLHHEPPSVGYVEPALDFWTTLREWLELTEAALMDHQLINDTIAAFTKRLLRFISIMEEAAYCELNNERLSDETYRFIAHIGDSIEQFTLAMIEPAIDRWEWAAGPDKSVAIFEKQPQTNASLSVSDEILYCATGNLNNIYIVVEIDGYLYLTKGAAFSYHEFPMPLDKELKDEQWQEIRRKLIR